MYNRNGELGRDALIEKFAPIIKRIAHHMAGRMPPNVSVDDLIQNGMIGLMDAMRKGSDGTPEQFESYVVQRARGAMLDGLRDMDWVPRTIRQEIRRVEAAVRALEQAHGHPPSEGELASAVGMTLSEYQDLLQSAQGHQILYLDDFGVEGGADILDRQFGSADNDPLKILADQSVRKRITDTISDLPEREKLVLSLYYEEDLNLREIAAVIGVSVSRVSQIQAQAVARVRAKMFEEDKRKGRQNA